MSVYQRAALVASFCLVVGLGATACSKKPPVVAPPPPPPETKPVVPPPPPPPPPPKEAEKPRALTEDELFAAKTVDQLNKERPLGDVFFALDQSTIRDEGKQALATNATWLKRWTSTRISIEGHCDERGTAEYNISLGERRATAVKSYLVELGVPADRIAIVSKGKEAPFCTEKNEACWQENRRGHFVITAK